MPTAPSMLHRGTLLIGALCALALSTLADTSFEERIRDAEKAVQAKRAEGKEAFYAEVEKQARSLLKEFPEKDDPYEMLLFAAIAAPTEKARAILQELNRDAVPFAIRVKANNALTRLERIGKPLAIKFKALDGVEMDLSALKPKVVLLDFWATWCGPCIEELPQLLDAYTRFHDHGFEIVGISLDQDRDALASFLKAKKIAWPQHFDGGGWKNALAQKYAVTSIPEMWLIDKKGILRDMTARDGLAEKIEKLLAE